LILKKLPTKAFCKGRNGTIVLTSMEFIEPHRWTYLLKSLEKTGNNVCLRVEKMVL
jgi:hypothetical protein